MKEKKVFVLRNNDFGDVLLATPLIRGIKRAFPESRISIGVGDWAKPLLINNPDLDEIVSCNAPWHNKQICRFPANSPKTFMEGLFYVLFSKEVQYIAKGKFSDGIDVLGSRQGSWLLRRAKIPNRLGVRGYAGGDNWCHDCIQFKEDRSVAESALEFLSILGAREKVDPRPLIYLSKQETNEAFARWGPEKDYKHRIVIAPGGGFAEKCWGDENYSALTKMLLSDPSLRLRIIGSEEDRVRVDVQQSKTIMNLCGELSLRQSAALVSVADFVITNTSLCMHLAGAFSIPSLTLLGDWYESTELHQKQWGYPESTVMGKELKTSVNHILSPFEAYELFQRGIQQTNPQN